MSGLMGSAYRVVGWGRISRLLVAGFGLVLAGCAGAVPALRSTPVADVAPEVVFRNLSAQAVRLYLSDGGSPRYLGRVGAMSTAALRVPGEMLSDHQRRLQLSVVPIGSWAYRSHPGNIQAYDLVESDLQRVGWTFSGGLISTLPLSELRVPGRPTRSASDGAAAGLQ